MMIKQKVGTKYIYGFFDMEKDTLSKTTLFFSSVHIQKNKNTSLDLKISKENKLFEIFNIKRECNSFVAGHHIYNIIKILQSIFIRGVLLSLKRSLNVLSTNPHFREAIL